MGKTSILITGDFVPHGRVLNMIKENVFEHVFNKFEDILSTTDINITNLECPFVNKSKPIRKIGPLLKAPIESAEIFRGGKINIVTLANNHILDFGKEGLADTITACNNVGIQTIGAGLNKSQLQKPLIIKKSNIVIGLINFAESEFSIVQNGNYGANPLDIQVIYNQITELKKSVDSIIIIAHGGHEFYKYPSPELVKRYRMLIDFGANAVVGHHPHCFSGFELYKHGVIFYSLGNFSFDWPGMNKIGWNDGYAVKLMIDNNRKLDFEIIPYKQGTSDIPGIRLLNDEEKILFNKEVNEINSVIASEELLLKKWEEYVIKMSEKYLTLIQPTNRLIKALQSRNLLPKIFYSDNHNRMMLLNLIRCESHREVLLSFLKDKR
jgi:poly-gamma-glutamate synthesis protein (capsule biosynthesis protein)